MTHILIIGSILMVIFIIVSPREDWQWITNVQGILAVVLMMYILFRMAGAINPL